MILKLIYFSCLLFIHLLNDLKIIQLISSSRLSWPVSYYMYTLRTYMCNGRFQANLAFLQINIATTGGYLQKASIWTKKIWLTKMIHVFLKLSNKEINGIRSPTFNNLMILLNIRSNQVLIGRIVIKDCWTVSPKMFYLTLFGAAALQADA